MIVKLKKFKKELNKSDLIRYFSEPKKFELEDINQEVDISDIKKTINLINNKDNIIDENNNEISLAATDAIISPILHKSFSKIPSKFFLDRAFLQFLSLDLFPLNVTNGIFCSFKRFILL